MKLRVALISTLALALVAAPSISSAERLEGGTFEWSISGGASRSSFDVDGTEVGDQTEFQLGTELGYFINSLFEIAVNLGYSRFNDEPAGAASRDANGFLFGTRLLANVPNGTRMTPYGYIGASIGSFSGSQEDAIGDESQTTLPRVGIGVRYFMADAVSFNMEFEFDHTDNVRGIKDLNADSLNFFFGFSVFLNRD